MRLGSKRLVWHAAARAMLLSMVLCFLMGVGAVSAEAATDAERAGARSAATAGADAFDAGKFQVALDLFVRAESLVHSPVHLSYIGQCQVKLGRLVEARETYLKLQRETVAPDAHDALKRAVAEAGTHLERIEPRLAYLTIKVEGAESGEAVAVTLNGTEIAPALVGIPAPTNPGEHTLRATTAGKDSGEIRVALAEGQRQEIVLKLVPLAGAASDVSANAAPPESAPSAGTDSGAASEGGGLAIPAYAALGVGVVGIGLGTYFAIAAGDAADEADKLCGGSRSSCMPGPGVTRDQISEKNDEAGSNQTLAIVGFAIGGVGLAAGVTLLILDMDKGDSSTSRGVRVSPYVGFDRVGLVGTF